VATTPKRLAPVPDIPALQEAGRAGHAAATWYTLWAIKVAKDAGVKIGGWSGGGESMSEREDRQDITELIQNWAFWRDTGEWDSLLAAFHPQGRMNATWYSGPAKEFVAGSRAGWERGGRSSHFIGGSRIAVRGAKAIAESRMVLMIRAVLEGEDVDVTCNGRFYDRLVKYEGAWRILERHCIYEKDRLDPVRPGARVTLDPALLGRFPEGYRHVAYVQTKRGTRVLDDMPVLRSPAREQLYRDAAAWLEAE